MYSRCPRNLSKKQWIPLIAEFGREDLDLLRGYLDANSGELERKPDWEKKYKGVLAHAIERNIILMLSVPNLQVTDVTSPMWAVTWHQYSRAKVLEGAPRPSKRRSWMEMASKRAIAEALSQQGRKVDRRDVGKWFERMEREPLEEFDGDAYEYWLKMSDPKAYERHFAPFCRLAKPQFRTCQNYQTVSEEVFSETARNKCSRKLGGLESTRLAVRSFLLHIRRCPHLGRGRLL